MHAIAYVTLMGLAAGVVGTGAGSTATAMVGAPSRRVLSVLMGLAGGVMLSVVFLDLVPESIEIGGLLFAIAGFVLGIGATAMVDLLTPHFHAISGDCENSRYLRASLLTGIGIAMHNLPEGLAIGASYAHGSSLGFSVALTIALHNIPEGMAMAAPMCAARLRPARIAMWGGVAGLPMAVGALIGVAIGGVSPAVLASCLGFAGGAMVFITADELIPDAQEFAVGHSGTFGIVLGVLAGMLLVYAS
ncbi:MAG: ZIP family metal transporter [Clostridia bacterium]|nr:ZIP family metal transporter [Clostridia bacterium]